MLTDLLNQAQTKAQEFKSEVLKFKSKEFLHAALAGSTLVIMADGHIAENEKSKMMAFIQSDDNLSVYQPDEVLATWKEYVQAIECDRDIGRAKALGAVGKLKGKTDHARLIMRMIIAIGKSDGSLSHEERQMATLVAQELGLSLEEFDLSP